MSKFFLGRKHSLRVKLFGHRLMASVWRAGFKDDYRHYWLFALSYRRPGYAAAVTIRNPAMLYAPQRMLLLEQMAPDGRSGLFFWQRGWLQFFRSFDKQAACHCKK